MKLFVLLVLLAITAYACLNISAITATLNKGLFAFESVDADNLQGVLSRPDHPPPADFFSAIVCCALSIRREPSSGRLEASLLPQ